MGLLVTVTDVCKTYLGLSDTVGFLYKCVCKFQCQLSKTVMIKLPSFK